MKKTLTLIITLVVCVTAFAAPPNLEVEKLFDADYTGDKTVSMQIKRSREMYFRSINISGNAALVKRATELYNKDLQRSENSNEFFEEGRTSFATMEIINNGKIIKIGISYSPDNSCWLFIKGEPEAFK